MSKHTRRLATDQQAIGDGNGQDMVAGWIPVGDWANVLHIDIVAETSPDMTVEIQVETIDGKTVTLHTEVIVAAISKSISFGDLPYSKIKANLPSYASGAVWITANFL